MTLSLHSAWLRASASMPVLGLVLAAAAGPAAADETCMSPYMAKITGQEDFVYVWTLGVEGVGDGSDKLVTVDVRPDSATYGKVVDSRFGRRAQRGAPRRLHRRPPLLLGHRARHQQDLHLRRPHRSGEPEAGQDHRRLRRSSGGVVGPHGAYALPGRMLISGLSNAKDKGGRTGLVEYTNDGEYVATHWMPVGGDGYDIPGIEHRRRLRLRRARPAAQERHADVVVHRLEQLHEDARQADPGRRGDEALRPDHGALGLPRARAEEGVRRARRAARDPLGLGREPQLRLHLDGADLEALADLRGRRRASGRPRQSPTSAIRPRCRCRSTSASPPTTDPVRRHLHGRQGARVRRQRSAQPEAGLRAEDRQAGQHGLAELGRQARLLHDLAARELGQDGRRTTSSSSRPTTGTASS